LDQNVEQIQHVSSKDHLIHLSDLSLSIFFSKLPILKDNLSQEKYESMNIVVSKPPLVAPSLALSANDNSKLVASEENFLQIKRGGDMQDVITSFKRNRV